MKHWSIILLGLFLVGIAGQAKAQQVLSLRDAVQTAVAHYGTIRAKAAYVKASEATVAQMKREALPNLVLAAQQDYGTVNGQNGPLYGFGGLSVASSGSPAAAPSNNAAYGGLYLTNFNWDFFAFGRARQRVNVAKSSLARDERDEQQEIFQHQIRVAAAYLNLLAAQRITASQQKNLIRADTFRQFVVARALNGLLPGVDSSQAAAEVAAAKIALLRARDGEAEQENRLAVLMGVPAQAFVLDTQFVSRVPAIQPIATQENSQHPVLRYYQSRVSLSDQQTKYLNTFKYPTFSLVGIYQGRGSGFQSDYVTDQTAYSSDYFSGINPTRSNYLMGVGVSWNLTSILRVDKQVEAQRYISQGLKDEYAQAANQIAGQLVLADTKITNALAAYREAPVQVAAASQAYVQRSVLYHNGLSNIVDITQALYTLNRAETDRDIAYTNVWQALLLRAAAAGNFSLFDAEL